MKGFDLGELLAAEVSKLDTSAGKDRYELIDIDLLDPDPENFYSMDGLEQLKENILLCGLLQPLRVKLSTEPGRYTVIAGHRRREAIRRLVDDGHKEFRMVPCIRDSGASPRGPVKLWPSGPPGATLPVTTELGLQNC